MIVALLNQKGGVGDNAARAASRRPMDPAKKADRVDRRSARLRLDWSGRRVHRCFDRLFGVIGLARDTLHREAPEFVRHSDHIVIAGPPRVAGLLRSALLAADLALIPAQPSPVYGLESAEMRAPIALARVFRPAFRARLVLNLCPARTINAREIAQCLAGHRPLALKAGISQSIIFAEAAHTGQLVFERDYGSLATREIAAQASEIEMLSP